jgi:hypothetical protein
VIEFLEAPLSTSPRTSSEVTIFSIAICFATVVELKIVISAPTATILPF